MAPADAARRKRLPCYRDREALLQAAVAGHLAPFEAVRAEDPLLMHGFDGVADYAGRTVLHLAAWHGHVALLDALLRAVVVDKGSARAPCIPWDKYVSHAGNTVLHTAATGGHVPVVEWLLSARGIDGVVARRNSKGFTAAHCAMEAGAAAIAAMLERHQPYALRPVSAAVAPL